MISDIQYTSTILVLNQDDPEKEYEKPKSKMSKIDNKQLKLIVSEMDFLNRTIEYKENHKDILIYIGTSIKHIQYLQNLYPYFEYFIYDTNITGFNDNDIPLFLEQRNNGKKIYLISTFSSNIEILEKQIKEKNDISLFQQKEKILYDDLLEQKRIVNAIRPDKAFLKFRMPHIYNDYLNEDLKYFDGVIFKLPFAPFKTSECRLLCQQDSYEQIVNWDHKKITKQLYFFNDVIREHKVITPINVENIPNIYDMGVLINIIIDYFKLHSQTNIYSQWIYNFIKIIMK